MIKVFKFTNPRLRNATLYFYSMAKAEEYRSKSKLDGPIEDVDLDDKKHIIDRFGEIHEVAKCSFFRREDDPSLIAVYEGTLYLCSIDDEEADLCGYKISD